jgi:hypothetical protein
MKYLQTYVLFENELSPEDKEVEQVLTGLQKSKIVDFTIDIDDISHNIIHLFLHFQPTLLFKYRGDIVNVDKIEVYFYTPGNDDPMFYPLNHITYWGNDKIHTMRPYQQVNVKIQKKLFRVLMTQIKNLCKSQPSFYTNVPAGFLPDFFSDSRQKVGSDFGFLE